MSELRIALREVLETLKKSDAGMTCGEVYESLQISAHDFRQHTNITTRMSELEDLGLVRRIGKRPCASKGADGHSVNLWVAVPPAEVRALPKRPRLSRAQLEAELDEQNKLVASLSEVYNAAVAWVAAEPASTDSLITAVRCARSQIEG